MTSDSRGFCDLHIHSIFSDSDAQLESIFQEARRKSLRCIAITDHDTVSGLIEARVYSRQYGVELIDAIEFSAQHKDSEVHILGYFVDPRNQRLLDELAQIRILRTQRLRLMADALAGLGLGVDSKELFEHIGSTIPTRLHLAMYLVKKNIVTSFKEAFKKYLAPGRPAYKSRFRHSVKEAVDIIKQAGGISVLAHPHIIAHQAFIEECIADGIEGLEVVYPTMSAAKSSLYQNLALKYDLVKSGGSDAHGSYKEFTSIGDVSVEYAWVEAMKERLRHEPGN